MNSAKQAKILSLRELAAKAPALPASWAKAAGLMRHKRKNLELHLKVLKKEWSRNSPS